MINMKEILLVFTQIYPPYIYLFKVNDRNTRKRCGKCSKLTMKMPERRKAGFTLTSLVTFSSISGILSLN